MPATWKNIAAICAFSLGTFALSAQPASLLHQSSAMAQESAPVRTIAIRASKYKFEPSEITLKKGETVKLELTSEDVKHSLVVPGLHLDAVMKKGQTTDVVITPEEAGDFKGECGIFCGFGHHRMHFLVHVTP
jgi:cytochrome c oxidase subunit 2